MLVDYELFAFEFILSLNLIAFVISGWALRTASWRQIMEVTERQHLLLGSGFFLTLFWLMHFEAVDGLWIHPLIVTSVALMVGFRFCVLVTALSTVAYLIIAKMSLYHWGGHFIINGVLPAAFIVYVSYWLRRKNPGNLFFYTLGVGFFGGALTIPLIAGIYSLILWFNDITLFRVNMDFKYQWILLGMFPEAFINGVIVSSITIFFPEWMKTFDEDYFLSK